MPQDAASTAATEASTNLVWRLGQRLLMYLKKRGLLSDGACPGSGQRLRGGGYGIMLLPGMLTPREKHRISKFVAQLPHTAY